MRRWRLWFLALMTATKVRLGKVSIAFKTFGVCDFSRLAVTDWRLRRWGRVFFGAYDSYPLKPSNELRF